LCFSAGDSDVGIGVCGWLLTAFSWLIVIVTLPFSLCVCFKVGNPFRDHYFWRFRPIFGEKMGSPENADSCAGKANKQRPPPPIGARGQSYKIWGKSQNLSVIRFTGANIAIFRLAKKWRFS
jgi:hypothetical protein